MSEETSNSCSEVVSKPLILTVAEGLFLKTREPEDAEALFSLVDKNRASLRTWLLWVDSTVSVDDTRKYIDECLTHFTQKTKIDFGIWHQGILVGSVGMFDIRPINQSAEIGYWLSREYMGKGIMTRCVERLVDYGFDNMQLNRIRIRCAGVNLQSAKVPQRLGFVHEGTHRQAIRLYDDFFDEEVYGLLRSDLYT